MGTISTPARMAMAMMPLRPLKNICSRCLHTKAVTRWHRDGAWQYIKGHCAGSCAEASTLLPAPARAGIMTAAQVWNHPPVGAIEDAGDALRKEAQRAPLQACVDALAIRRNAACHQEHVPHLRTIKVEMSHPALDRLRSARHRKLIAVRHGSVSA